MTSSCTLPLCELVTVLPMCAGKFQDPMDRGRIENQWTATDDRSGHRTRRKGILLLFMFHRLADQRLEDVWCAALQCERKGAVKVPSKAATKAVV